VSSLMHRFRNHMMSVGVLLLLAGVMAACATQENIKKANGYYQEGLADLERDRQRAFVSFQKAIQVNPRHRDAHYALGHLYAGQEKYKNAEKEFREVLRIDPDYSEAHTHLGVVLAQLNRWEEAIQSYRQALSNPLYATPDLARFHLGRALAHEGDIQGATQAFEDALLVTPPNVPPAILHYELGKAYYRLGYETKAREALTRVTSLDKGGQYAAEAGKLLERLKP
jgi:type IV pilus assembly protein PilF